MNMRDEDTIDAGNFAPQTLLAEIRAGIDDEAMVLVLNPEAGAKPLIMSIPRNANRALALNFRNSLRCARAEELESKSTR